MPSFEGAGGEEDEKSHESHEGKGEAQAAEVGDPTDEGRGDEKAEEADHRDLGDGNAGGKVVALPGKATTDGHDGTCSATDKGKTQECDGEVAKDDKGEPAGDGESGEGENALLSEACDEAVNDKAHRHHGAHIGKVTVTLLHLRSMQNIAQVDPAPIIHRAFADHASQCRQPDPKDKGCQLPTAKEGVAFAFGLGAVIGEERAAGEGEKGCRAEANESKVDEDRGLQVCHEQRKEDGG